MRRKRNMIQTNVITSLDFILVSEYNAPPVSRLMKVMMVKMLPVLRLKKRKIKIFKTNLLDINVKSRIFRFLKDHLNFPGQSFLPLRHLISAQSQ